MVPLHLGVLELAILPLPPREVEPGPSLDLVAVRDGLVPVVRVHLGRVEGLAEVCAGLVIQDRVDVREDAVLLELGDAVEVVLLGAPLGPDAALDVELSEVPQVVDVVAGNEGRKTNECQRGLTLRRADAGVAYPLPSCDEALVGGGSQTAVIPMSPSNLAFSFICFQYTPPPASKHDIPEGRKSAPA